MPIIIDFSVASTSEMFRFSIEHVNDGEGLCMYSICMGFSHSPFMWNICGGTDLSTLHMIV
jgi:hypothetical protein